MADFQRKSGGSWSDVPLRACPEAGRGAVVVKYPDPTDATGAGAPCGAFGLPWIELRADEMVAGASAADGMRWWHANFAAATDLTAPISLTAYDERTGAWVKYAGTLWRPTWDSVRDEQTDAARTYFGVRILVKDVAVTT